MEIPEERKKKKELKVIDKHVRTVEGYKEERRKENQIKGGISQESFKAFIDTSLMHHSSVVYSIELLQTQHIASFSQLNDMIGLNCHHEQKINKLVL